MSEQLRQGVLLVNLGTPDQPDSKAVKAFLSEFLHDKRVVDMTRWLWCPILHGVILPIRSPKVAKLYQGVWMEQGSPLMVYSQRQRAALQQRLDIPVELAMTYGTPSIQQGYDALLAKGVDDIIILPLYPQYSGTTTAAVNDKWQKVLAKQPEIPSYRFIKNYHNHSSYIDALATSVREYWQKNGESDYLLCSFHGIPQRFADNGDVYPQHCEQTTKLLALKLGLDESRIGMSYQSRFGREPWLMPYTDQTLKQLAAKGIKKLDIIAPAFSADCLETLEELSEECKEIYIENGGQEYRYIPCLNDSITHIDMMEQLVKQHQ
jgi:ferrochelatase